VGSAGDAVASPDVTVVVVSWNTRELLARCLESMAADVRAGRAAVCVVDNRSDDGSAEMVQRDFSWAKLVRAEGNVGFGPAVNLAVASLPRTAWIAPCNADVALSPGALPALIAAGVAMRRRGAVAPMLVGETGDPQHSVFPFPDIGFTLLFNLGLHRLWPRWGDRRCVPGCWDPHRPREVPWAIGAFLLVDRDAWDEVGGFDPAQWMYAEDLDLGWRLHRAGRPTRYVPEAPVVHFGSAAAEQAWGDARVERWMDATYAWMLRRRGAPRTRVVAAINVAGAGAREALFGALSRLDGERWSGPRAESREWRRVHAIGLRRRSRIGTLSAAPPADIA
jgi:N-acetylglucosaminyl-diphospho-decaprenol L-rhamnosyltransferase